MLVMIGRGRHEYFRKIHKKQDCSEENFAKMAEKNGVAILFPYLRSIFCDASKMANISPILLPSINVVKLLEYKKGIA